MGIPDETVRRIAVPSMVSSRVGKLSDVNSPK